MFPLYSIQRSGNNAQSSLHASMHLQTFNAYSMYAGLLLADFQHVQGRVHDDDSSHLEHPNIDKVFERLRGRGHQTMERLSRIFVSILQLDQ